MLLSQKRLLYNGREPFWPLGLGDYLKVINWFNTERIHLKLYRILVFGNSWPWGKRKDLENVKEKEKVWRLVESNLKGRNYSKIIMYLNKVGFLMNQKIFNKIIL